MDIKCDVWLSHIKVCGSKTTQCPKCGKYIQKKDWDVHQTIPCKPPVVIPGKPKPSDMADKVIFKSNF